MAKQVSDDVAFIEDVEVETKFNCYVRMRCEETRRQVGAIWTCCYHHVCDREKIARLMIYLRRRGRVLSSRPAHIQ